MKGHCLCGAVTLQTEDHERLSVCHCDMCRRWGGGPLLAVHVGTQLQISGEEAVGRYRSSDWAERGFCRHCGTHLWYRLLADNGYALPVGLFQEQDFDFAEQIFVDSKPAYYDFANDTEKMTGAEVFAKFAPG